MQEFKTYSRPYTALHPLEQELTIDLAQSHSFDLSYLGVIDCIGDKDLDYLQGQLTCDLRDLEPNAMQSGLQCNLQGRILAIITVVNMDGVKLIVPRDLIPATIESFAKTAMLSRVRMVENTEYKVLGVNQASKLLMQLIPNSQVATYDRGSLAWHVLRLQQNHIEIYPQTRGKFLPHRLGFHKTNLISFNKGCYKGQEIIARMHYRSEVKHELVIAPVQDKPEDNTEDLVDYSILDHETYIEATIRRLGLGPT